MNPMTPLGLPALAVSLTREALAWGLASIVLSTWVYGITALQAYSYFRNGKQDSAPMKFFVAFLVILDAVSLILAINSLYESIATHLEGKWLSYRLPVTLVFENGTTYLIATLTQCFLAYRIWALSRRNALVVGGIIVLSFVALGAGIAICVYGYIHPDTLPVSSLETRIVAGVANGLNVACDVVITTALAYCLHSRRTGFARTDSLIRRLVMYAVNCGVLTAIGQACLTITDVAFPGHSYHMPFDLLTGKLYCNTLLATLNSRKAMRDEDNVMEVGSLVLDRINTSSAGNQKSGGAPLDPAGASTPTFVVDMCTNMKTPTQTSNHDVEASSISLGYAL